MLKTAVAHSTATIAAGLALLALAGCSGKERYDGGLTSAIRDHYAANATEEEGVCGSPKIDTILEHRPAESTADGQEVVMVRYSYFDRHADMDAALDRVVHLSQPCAGIAERRFTIEGGPPGYRVAAMSGERRDEESRR